MPSFHNLSQRQPRTNPDGLHTIHPVPTTDQPQSQLDNASDKYYDHESLSFAIPWLASLAKMLTRKDPAPLQMHDHGCNS